MLTLLHDIEPPVPDHRAPAPTPEPAPTARVSVRTAVSAVGDGLSPLLARAALSRQHEHDDGDAHFDATEEDLYGGHSKTGTAPVQIVNALTNNRMPTAAEWLAATPTSGKIRGKENPELAHIDVALQNYDQALLDHANAALGDPAAGTRPRLLLLYDIEQSVYDWFNRRQGSKSKHRTPMLAMLDAMQAEHIRLVVEAVTAAEPITVPGHNSLTLQQNDALQQLWTDLLAGNANIDITEDRDLSKPWEPTGTTLEHHAGFRNETLAQFARLLGTEGGRHTLIRIQAQNPGNAADRRVLVRPQENAKPTPSPATGVNAFGGEQPTDLTTLVRGGGIGSKITMPSALRDSTMVAKDTHGDELLSPAWLVLGHELIHAVHNLRGRNRNKVPIALTPKTRAKQEALWKNLEEKHTILLGNTSEMRLRRERGLMGLRHGHGE